MLTPMLPLFLLAVGFVRSALAQWEQCSAKNQNCMFTGCCTVAGETCYQKDRYYAGCKPYCEAGVINPNDAVEHRVQWTCAVVKSPVGPGPWARGLIGSTVWDCNGAECDAKKLVPYDMTKMVLAPAYAPILPEMFDGWFRGADEYGEKLWATGYASEGLFAHLSGDGNKSVKCGRCVLIRNAMAEKRDMTAVVLLKGKCKGTGCTGSALRLHINVPGFDNLTMSGESVCGSTSRENTYISSQQARYCANWQNVGENSKTGCDCQFTSDDKPESQYLFAGCDFFKRWGWFDGQPELQFQPVDCPSDYVEHTARYFDEFGVVEVDTSYTWWQILLIVLFSVCCCMCLVQVIVSCCVNRQGGSQLMEE